MLVQSLVLTLIACSDSLQPSISVRGIGVKTVKPDQAHVWVYAVGNGILVSDALADANKRVQAITEAVRKLDPEVSAPEVVTVSIGREEKRFWRGDEKDESRPQVMQRVLFKLPVAPDRAAAVADAAVRAGAVLDVPRSSWVASEINSNIYYTIKDEAVLKTELIKAAIEDARANAQKLAILVGKKLGDIISFNEYGQNEMFVYPLERGRLASRYLGTDPEKLEVRETIELRFEWHNP